eukprot:10072731-Ditylum_brightwellii.AAC.1
MRKTQVTGDVTDDNISEVDFDSEIRYLLNQPIEELQKHFMIELKHQIGLLGSEDSLRAASDQLRNVSDGSSGPVNW